MAGSSREAMIDYELLRGRQKETVVKELCVESDAAYETFRFKPPNKMADHGSTANGIYWIDDHIDYRELQRSSMRPWQVSSNSTPKAFRNARSSS